MSVVRCFSEYSSSVRTTEIKRVGGLCKGASRLRVWVSCRHGRIPAQRWESDNLLSTIKFIIHGPASEAAESRNAKIKHDDR